MVRALVLAGILTLMLLVPMWLKRGGDAAPSGLPVKEKQAASPAAQTTPPLPQAQPSATPAAQAPALVPPPAAWAGNSPAPMGHGLTFAASKEPTPVGVAHLSCHGVPAELDQPHEKSCNPYKGDTSCRTVLPVLCISEATTTKPPGVNSNFYQGWTGASLAATQPVMGADLDSVGTASARCSKELGQGWRMAEFHDGQGGWGLQGMAGTGLSGRTRYWVHINDQKGNCWNSSS